MSLPSNSTPRRHPDAKFFGEFYIKGDNSLEGYRAPIQQDLMSRTHEEVLGTLKLLDFEPFGGLSPTGVRGKDILDCPCGYGRHSVRLTHSGHRVVGVDINPTHLEKAKAEAAHYITNPLERDYLLQYEQQDMRHITYDKRFDAVINMFYSFGFFETDEENKQVLENFYRALKPGGKLLMHTDVNIPFITSGKYKTHEERKLANGNILNIHDRYNHDTKRIEGSWTINNAQSNDTETKEYSVRVYTAEEFTTLCQEVGFTTVEIFADRDGKKYKGNESDSDLMIVVAQK